MTRHLLLFICLLLPLPVAAQPIESETLAPMDIAPPPSDPAAASYKPEPYYKPVTPPPVSTGTADDGMSGATGGSSAYDLGAPPAQSAETPYQPYNSERSGVAADPAPVTPAANNNPDAPPAPRSTLPYGGSIGNAPPAKYSYENKKFCTLKISFGSRGAGIDEKTAERMKAYLDANTDKLSYTRADWGREGEYDYCLDITQHNKRAQVYTALKKLMPAPRRHADSTGDVTVTGAGFTTLTTR